MNHGIVAYAPNRHLHVVMKRSTIERWRIWEAAVSPVFVLAYAFQTAWVLTSHGPSSLCALLVSVALLGIGVGVAVSGLRAKPGWGKGVAASSLVLFVVQYLYPRFLWTPLAPLFPIVDQLIHKEWWEWVP
jgi:hypothetical protein